MTDTDQHHGTDSDESAGEGPGKELGLLRVLGLSSVQVRGMITLEALHMVTAATLAGIALGSTYGWAGAQSLLGFFAPVPLVVPLGTMVAVAGCVVALVATVRPVRDVLSTSPVGALSGELGSGPPHDRRIDGLVGDDAGALPAPSPAQPLGGPLSAICSSRVPSRSGAITSASSSASPARSAWSTQVSTTG